MAEAVVSQATIDALPKEVRERIRSRPRNATEQFKALVIGTSLAIALGLMVVAVLVAMGGILPFRTRYYTDFGLAALIVGAIPYATFRNRELNRVKAMDDKFPDFLRDLAESARAGMTLPRALTTAAAGEYGALTPEIRKMSAQVEWGVDFTDALGRFRDRVKSPLIERIVSLIIEARNAGGNMVDVLTAASTDAREIKQIVEQRNNQMGMYGMVIYITFFVFIAVVLVLQGQFIPAFHEAAGAAAAAGTGGAKVGGGGGFSIKDFNPDDFNTLFFHAAIVQALGGGLVGGVLAKGHPLAGLRGVVIMLSVAWVSFRFFTGQG